jgi:cell division protein FtsL
VTHEQLLLTFKAFGVFALTVVSGVQVVLASDLLTAAVPAITTAVGLAALVWKLATDRTATQDANRQWVEQAERYESLLDRADKRILKLEDEINYLHDRINAASIHLHDDPPSAGETPT